MIFPFVRDSLGFIAGSYYDVLAFYENTCGRSLTKREVEVVACIANDMSGKEIAFFLGVTLKTVEFHRRRICERLGVHGTAGIVKYAIRHGIANV